MKAFKTEGFEGIRIFLVIANKNKDGIKIRLIFIVLSHEKDGSGDHRLLIPAKHKIKMNKIACVLSGFKKLLCLTAVKIKNPNPANGGNIDKLRGATMPIIKTAITVIQKDRVRVGDDKIGWFLDILKFLTIIRRFDHAFALNYSTVKLF